MEARNKTVQEWFSMVREGQVTLPRFQRYEAWRPTQIVGVLENILQVPSLPIGALLVLEVGDQEIFHSRPISGAPKIGAKPVLHLLDGQQRMTALWRSLTDNYEDFTVFVTMQDPEHPNVEIMRRKRMPNWAKEPTECLAREMIPASILCPGSDGEERLSKWTDDANAPRPKSMDIMRLRQSIATYQVPFLSLPVTTEQATALDVFIKMNTSASPLKDFDIVVAQLEGAVGKSLHDMIDKLELEVPDAAKYGKIEDTALAIGALLNEKPPLKKTYLDTNFGNELSIVWDDVVNGLKRGIEFLRQEAIFNERLLPTEVIVYLSSALWAKVPANGADMEGRASSLIRKAIWRASFSERYLKTATTRAFSDYKAILDLIENPSSTSNPDLFDDDHYPLPTAEELIRAGWPTRKDRLGRAIIAVSLYGGGHDFADDSRATPENVWNREYHHIYPKSLIQDFSDHEVNSAVNCALISWKTNRVIAAQTPEQYLDERAKDANATEDQVRKRLESNLIPYEALKSGDFKYFLDERSKLIQNSMQKLCDGSRI